MNPINHLHEEEELGILYNSTTTLTNNTLVIKK